ncbi:MAG: acyl carrier protein [Verrucomicrobiota bacterium]|jgi:acyl carrier protein
MAEKSIEQRVKEIIAENLEVNADQVVGEAKLIEDLGADSLDAVELIMNLEEEFGLEIPDEAAEGLVKVSDVIAYIEERKGK